jgi:uncharacterized RDD family membrane protein YckC
MSNKVTLLERANKAVGRRIAAALIDLALCMVAFIVATANFGTTTTTVRDDMAYSQASLTGLPFVVFSLLVLAYFVVMEWRLGGTVGKLLVRVQVVDDRGGRISLQKSLVRNVLRIVDAFPFIFPYLVGLVMVASTGKKQRVGDKAAGTLVVRREQPLEQSPETVHLDAPHH